MQLIVDANPIISILIKPGKTIDLLFIEELELFAPDLLFEELERNKYIIIQKSGLAEEEISKLFFILRQRITVIPKEEFVKFREKAEEICPDPKDITYFALALYLRCPIWTNEKKLKKQDHVIIHTTQELMRLFNL